MKSAVKLENVKFQYEKNNVVIKDLTLSIGYGEKIFIHGPSGSGKSTLLNIIANVLRPSCGSINILGEQTNKLNASQNDKFRGDNIGFIFQNFNLIPYLSIYENIMIPLISSIKRNQKVQGDFDKEIKRIAKELEIFELLNKKVTELSVGQQQRVAVARALIGNPEIIIADEPTSSLDDAVTDKFMQLLIKEHKHKNFTLIFVSHDRRLSKYFDKEINLLDINQGPRL